MTSKDLYWELSKIFSSPHNDTGIEMSEAEAELREALGRGHTHQQIIFKMRQMLECLRNEGEPYRSKLSAVIRNRFWEKSFTTMIPYKPFIVEDF
jgi:hypothetical protein